MRKIEEAMCAAVKKRMNWECDNTRVQVRDGGNWVKVFLLNNLIYTDCSEDGTKRFTLAGHNTLTTRNKLRALGVDICGGKSKTSYNGNRIESDKWYKV